MKVGGYCHSGCFPAGEGCKEVTFQQCRQFYGLIATTFHNKNETY